MNKEHRPWGYFEVLSDKPDHKVKRIVVSPGQRLSLQRHRMRAEHWYLLSGIGIVTINNKDVDLKSGQSIDIDRGAWHRMRNAGETETIFIEIQTGEYFGEDDIERLADDYGRV